MDHHPGVLGILRRAHLDRELEIARELPRRLKSFPRVLVGGLSFAEELGERRDLVGELVQAFAGLERLLVEADLAEDLLGFLRPRPEVGSRGLLLQLLERAPRRVAIKGSPGAPPGVPRRRSVPQ
jgi:hypothetical protein